MVLTEGETIRFKINFNVLFRDAKRIMPHKTL